MQVESWVQYLSEFLGTAILLMLGNGAVANVELKGTKGHASGWLTIAIGYGMGVMIPALMFGNVSGNHINPAFTIGLAVGGAFSWAQVAPYIAAQLLGAIVGQAIVVAVYRPYYQKTKSSEAILASFATTDNAEKDRKGKLVNGFLNEFFGSFILFFGAVMMTSAYFGASAVNQQSQYIEVYGKDMVVAASNAAGSLAVAHLALGFLVMVLVTSFGGPTGPALNPARDFGPRLLHHFLPESILGEHKGSSEWWYAWVPVVAPILAAICAVLLKNAMLG